MHPHSEQWQRAPHLRQERLLETMAYEDPRVRRLIEELPKNRPISKAEAERVLVEMYRIERNSERIAARMGCSGSYVLNVVRRHEPDLIWRGRRRGGRARLPDKIYDLREARKIWRAEGYAIRRAEQDARMRRAHETGESLEEIARREGLGRNAVLKRISNAEPDDR